MTQLYQNPDQSEELKKKKNPPPPPLPPGGGGFAREAGREVVAAVLRLRHSCLRGPRPHAEPRRSAAADWAARPAAQPIRCLGSGAIHESGRGEEAWGAGAPGYLWASRSLLRRPLFRRSCSFVLALPLPAPARPLQATPRLGAEEQDRLSGSASRAGPGSQTLPPSVNCGHEVIFFLPLLIEIICFQFPDKFIEFPLRLGPLGCTVCLCSCSLDPHNFAFLDLHGLQFPEPQ